MTPSPVGMRCPECMRRPTKVVRGVGEASLFSKAPATFILIGLNVAVFVAEIGTGGGGFQVNGSSLVFEFGLFGPLVAEGEWYRLVTSAFLHGSLFHIAGNMILLYFLGRLLEPGIGTPRFVAIYLASLLAGSFGALLFAPDALSYGASGAVFGILAATFVIARGRGIDALASSVGVLILLNLAFSFGVPGISIGAHLGGLVGGFFCALLVIAGERGMLGQRHFPAEMIAIAAFAVLSILGALAVA
jgi:membrane associated rhomboid family serine protease